MRTDELSAEISTQYRKRCEQHGPAEPMNSYTAHSIHSLRLIAINPVDFIARNRDASRLGIEHSLADENCASVVKRFIENRKVTIGLSLPSGVFDIWRLDNTYSRVRLCASQSLLFA